MPEKSQTPPDLAVTVPAGPSPAAPAKPPAPARGGGSKFRLRILVGIPFLLVLAAIGFVFFLTTDPGFRAFVLPRVAKSLGREITAAHAEWHFPSLVRLKDVRIGPPSHPLLQSKLLTARFDLWEVLRGNNQFSNITLESASLHLSQEEEDSASQSPAPPLQGSPRSAPSSSAPRRFSCDACEVTGLEIIYDARWGRIVLRDARVSARSIIPGGTIPIEYQGELSLKSGTTTTLSVPLKSSLTLNLDKSLAPTAISGTAELGVSRGRFKDGTIVAAPASVKLGLLFLGSSAYLNEAQATLPKIDYTSAIRTTSLGNVQLKLQNVRPGGSMTLAFQGDVDTRGAKSDFLTARGQIRSTLGMELSAAFEPVAAKGEIALDGLSGRFAGEPLDGFAVVSKVDLGLSNGTSMLKECRISLQKGGAALASITAVGPLDPAKKEAELEIQAGPLKSNVLNLYFADRKLDFQNTSLGYTGHFSLGKGGNLLKAEGRLEASPLAFTSPTLPAGAWKPAQVTADHSVEFDFAQKTATITRLSIDGTQGQKPLLKGNLSQPVTLTWNASAPADFKGSDAEFTLQLFAFDVAPLAPLMGFPADWKLSSAVSDGNLKVAASKRGQSLAFDGHLGLSHIALTMPGAVFADATLLFDGRAGLDNLQSARFDSLGLKVTEKAKPLLAATVSGAFDFNKKSGAGTVLFETQLPNVLAVKPVANLSVVSGVLAGKGEWKQEGASRYACQGHVTARDLSLTYGKVQYQKAAVTFDGNVDSRGQVLKMNDSRLAVSIDGKPAGMWQGSLSYDSETNDKAFTFKMSDWKAPIFAPLFAVWLPDRKLRSIELNTQGEMRCAQGEMTVKAKADVKKLLVESDKSPGAKPLNATLSTDVTCATNGTYTIRSLALQLDPTPSAKNLFQISGSLRNEPSLLFANLKIQGQSLDLTSYYDQLYPTKGTSLFDSTILEPTATPPPLTVDSVVEPSSNPLPKSSPSTPARDVTLQISSDSLRIHEFTVTEVNASWRQNGGIIQLNDGRLKIGGAPATFKITSQPSPLDPNRPAFKYYAKVVKLEIGPLVDIFKPESKGMVGGTMDADVSGSGDGIALADLYQNLTGDLHMKVREAHLEKVPSIQRSLAQAGTALKSQDIAMSTINDMDASFHIGGAKLHTENFHLRGSAVEVTMKGDLYFDHRLALEVPAKVPPAVAQASPLLRYLVLAPVPVDDKPVDPENWIHLPAPGKLTGTMEHPKFEIDYSKFKVESLAAPVLNILKDIFDKKKDNQNQPQDQPQNQQEQKDPLQNLLDGLFKKKK